jgi:cytochrome c oxidase assembly protein subunit 15
LSPGLRRAALGVLPLLALQLVYGAFMAGTHAGYLYATFPDMNGRYAPSAFFTAGGLVHNLFDNPITIHYLHRALALVVFLYATLLAVLLRRERSEARAASYLLLGATLGQALLGAMTVVLRMPIGVAVAHQAGAYVLCSTAVLLAHAVLGATPSPVTVPGVQPQPELRRA